MQNESESKKPCFSFYALLATGVALLALTGVLAWLAQSFPYQREPDRPIVTMVVVSWVASAISLLAIFVGLTARRSQRWITTSIILFAVAFRLILVFSNPILEVDYYRYIWDGIAANQGVSPYQFSPKEVLESRSDDPDLAKLQEVAYNAEKPSAGTIVSRVHFEEYTTLYPPVSQVAFRQTTKLVPDDASVETHITAIKCMLVLFDVGVIACLAWLLTVLRKHPAWLIAYAWNPLVLKEISNGGHLDSIAIFFFTAGIAVFLWIAKRSEPRSQDAIDDGEVSTSDGMGAGIGSLASGVSGSLIGLGIGAKLFPVVLVPALFVFLLARRQIVQAAVFGLSCLAVSVVALWPMFNHPPSVADAEAEARAVVEVVDANGVKKPKKDTNDGLAVFITNWRMNDVIFSLVYQNIEYDWGGKRTAWYVVVPNKTRIEWCEDLREVVPGHKNPAYFIARLATVALFAVFYLIMLVRIWKTESASDMAGLLFLIMGIFFFLQPTQNPWYWLWAMPFVCFAKNRGWLFVSMALFVYYLRFWFEETNQGYIFGHRNYVGVDCFDHLVVWVEFIAIVAVLLAFGIPSYLSRAKKAPEMMLADQTQ